jgi:lipopolysaccharide transport system ATP-binding protein
VIDIVIEVHVPMNISREHLSVACSIKDLKGTDLIVSTTHDFECRRLPDKAHFSVSFRLVNPLVTGKYLLVAAVENRQHRDVHYYEYVEGAHYFSSLSNEHFFGLFQPPIEQQVLV